jgi:hypothetical protein
MIARSGCILGIANPDVRIPKVRNLGFFVDIVQM